MAPGIPGGFGRQVAVVWEGGGILIMVLRWLLLRVVVLFSSGFSFFVSTKNNEYILFSSFGACELIHSFNFICVFESVVYFNPLFMLLLWLLGSPFSLIGTFKLLKKRKPLSTTVDISCRALGSLLILSLNGSFKLQK